MEDKLNPITGLPEKPVLSKIDNIKVQKQAFLNNLSGSQSFDTEPFATSQLDYNTYLDALGPDKFKLQFGEERLTRQLQEKQQADLIAGINQRAEDQGFFSEAFNSVVQAGLGEVVSGGVAGIGYLFDVDTLFGIAEDSGEFGNFISRFGEAAKEQTKDWFPVYQHVGEEVAARICPVCQSFDSDGIVDRADVVGDGYIDHAQRFVGYADIGRVDGITTHHRLCGLPGEQAHGAGGNIAHQERVLQVGAAGNEDGEAAAETCLVVVDIDTINRWVGIVAACGDTTAGKGRGIAVDFTLA